MTSFNKKILSLLIVDMDIYNNAELRDQNLILIFAFCLPVAACLAGYAFYTVVDFLLAGESIAVILGVLAGTLMYLHDRSMLATEKNHQIVAKLLISIAIAGCFTVVKNTQDNYTELRTEMIQDVADHNNRLTIRMNDALEEVDKQKREIMKDIESAAAVYKQNRQPLYDARRTLKSFEATEQERKDRIKTGYKAQYIEPNISQTDILSLQLSKLTSFSRETLVGLMLAFIYFIFEALPAIMRIALIDGTYMQRITAKMNRERSLRNQQDGYDDQFITNNGDDITPLLEKKILEAKMRILNNAGDEVELAHWTYKKKLWEEKGIHPLFGQNMDDIDSDEFFGFSKDENADETNFSENGQEDMKEEEIPAFK